ncbi:hypothetical protein [Paraburkholderia phytofirmans]|jgi:hypothetical protein|uniref:Uncharacterized protein n=1 Tax=Paraburkholderia phytofirmans OLGA172 TaxID=1417228 RepID=A0A160FHV0_9BURK|nr:hypothetical protein [Paraburkholderia phytofirmans]ANB71751.1 hypothetical protein AYM40_04710 [Paraburkholderia phytofirmans OLGA172]
MAGINKLQQAGAKFANSPMLWAYQELLEPKALAPGYISAAGGERKWVARALCGNSKSVKGFPDKTKASYISAISYCSVLDTVIPVR